MPKHFIYILEAKDGKYYTGYTTDIERRIQEHKEGKGKGAKFTRAFGVKKLLYSEECSTKSKALKREAEIKSWTREEKEKFLSSR